MHTGTPSVGKIVTMVLFTLSCIGLLLFLWLSFGGTIPFAAQGYRFRVAFPNAAQLADQADVRIAGVSVGKVVAKSLDPQGNRTIATIQMDNQFAPVHKDARAILRTKTILGETYVELSPGTPNSPTIPDGGMLARSNVQPAVQLDQIFDALDPRTRAAFRQWQQELAKAVRGNGQNLNNVLGNLPAFAADATDLLQVLDVQHTAIVNLVRNGGTVFAALNHNQSALRNLITSGEQTFATTAANNNSIIQTFHVFPTFLNETKLTMARLQTFAQNTNPLVTELQPVARNLAPTLNSVTDPVSGSRVAVHEPRAADHRLEDGAAGDQRRAQRRHPAARRARPVPVAAQPDPDLAVAAPAADFGLHLQRRDRDRGQDDLVQRRRHRSLPAPVRARRPRDAVVRDQPRQRQPRQHLPAAAVARRSAVVHRRRQVPGQLRAPVMGLQQHRRARQRRAGAPARPRRRCSPRAQQACWVAPPLGALIGQSNASRSRTSSRRTTRASSRPRLRSRRLQEAPG